MEDEESGAGERAVAGRARLEEADFVEGNLWVADRKGGIRALYFLLVPLGLLELWIGARAGWRPGMWTLAVPALLAFGAAVRLSWSRRGRRAFAATPEVQRDVEVEVSPDGVAIRTAASRARLAWASVRAWGESARSFYLLTSAHAFLILPKRAFDTEHARAHVRDLLGAWVIVAEDEKKARSRGGRVLLVWLLLAVLLVALYTLLGHEALGGGR